MTPAEFRVAHIALGVSAPFLAKRLGVYTSRVWQYATPDRNIDVPEHIAHSMRELQADFDAAVDDLTARALAEDLDALPLYRTADEFDAAVPMLAGWGLNTQGLVVAEVQRRLQLPVEWVVPA